MTEEHRRALTESVPGEWLDIALGIAHYEACDAVGFAASELEAIGADVNRRAQASFLATIARAARSAGITPWTGILQAKKVWARLFRGGDIEIAKLGPKEARAICAGMPMARIPYFRSGFRSTVRAALELFCARVYVKEDPPHANDTTLAIRMMWA
jgi:hypothetical protein